MSAKKTSLSLPEDNNKRLQVLEKDDDGFSYEERAKEKVRLVQDFLHADGQDQLSSLVEKMKSSKLSEEGYLSEVKALVKAKMKALLGRGLCVENGSHVDGEKKNGKTNGFVENGSHKDEDEGEGTMDTQEETDVMKSPSASKGKGGQKSKADSAPKKSTASSRVTRNSGKQPTILSKVQKRKSDEVNGDATKAEPEPKKRWFGHILHEIKKSDELRIKSEESLFQHEQLDANVT